MAAQSCRPAQNSNKSPQRHLSLWSVHESGGRTGVGVNAVHRSRTSFWRESLCRTHARIRSAWSVGDRLRQLFEKEQPCHSRPAIHSDSESHPASPSSARVAFAISPMMPLLHASVATPRNSGCPSCSDQVIYYQNSETLALGYRIWDDDEQSGWRVSPCRCGR